MENCPLCKGTGWQFIDDSSVIECTCGKRQKDIYDSRLKFASIPELYKDVRLKDIATSYYKRQESKEALINAAKIIKVYLDEIDANIESGRGLFLWSVTKGSGKTMVATALANELINEHHKFVKFATSLDILDEIRATYNKDNEETEDNLLKDLARADILVIDDFGTERSTDWAGEKFYQIVNKRYINNKVTIYTSNYDLTKLKYDDRITNRIREKSYVVHFPEESVRESKATIDNAVLMEKVR